MHKRGIILLFVFILLVPIVYARAMPAPPPSPGAFDDTSTISNTPPVIVTACDDGILNQDETDVDCGGS